MICELVNGDTPIIINKHYVVAVYPNYAKDGDEHGSYIEVVNSEIGFYVKETYSYLERILLP